MSGILRIALHGYVECVCVGRGYVHARAGGEREKPAWLFRGDGKERGVIGVFFEENALLWAGAGGVEVGRNVFGCVWGKMFGAGGGVEECIQDTTPRHAMPRLDAIYSPHPHT